MSCTTADEKALIDFVDAERYADPGTLCSPSCRQALKWSDWETDVSKAMYGLLRHLENILRSTVSTRLAAHYGRDDWWNARRLRLTHGTMEKIRDAEAKLARASVSATPAAVQREVTLGFWVSLLGRGADYETQLWRPMSSGFPGYRGRRRPLYTRLDHLRLLRNKVAHQDRIGGRDLAADRRSVLTVIGYVSQAAALRVEAADTDLPALLANRPGACAQRGGSGA
ncbi:hypothetical protein IQ279_04830 [Streptomyces verrucosisporus]|uniref:hypothetical protein n=1 Tax=Streptomyces verrucosisporus TaxID=1695161 RepID=UPI0019D293CD|nr:hypothetical protein [Streptomyces verrucosisporus]MBN3928969.1 hypothetical protein [Streptomyces verrucosisporus]